jgi:hypothetical protein
VVVISPSVPFSFLDVELRSLTIPQLLLQYPVTKGFESGGVDPEPGMTHSRIVIPRSGIRLCVYVIILPYLSALC